MKLATREGIMEKFIVSNIQHTYSHKASYGHYSIEISPKTGVGWFQHVLWGHQRGVLRFERGVLVDVDSDYGLPRDVVDGLRAAGFVVPV